MPTDIVDDEQPLVSIICRSTGRPELQHALASVAAQTHSPLELILVDASGEGLDIASDSCAPVRLVVVSEGRELPRAAAANAGLRAANGVYLMFLDEDDWITPDHIAGLLVKLKENPDIRAAYSSTQKTTPDGEPVDILFAQDFDPVLLMRDNYIPIHAMLFAGSLLAQDCAFDERFDIYEDWDFWLQLQQHTEFLHVNLVTAFYREGGESATAVDDTSIRYDNTSPQGQARARLFDKWLPRFSGERFNALLGQQSALIRELGEKLDAEHTTNLENQKLIRQLVAERDKAREEAEHRSHEVKNLAAVRKGQEAHIETLEATLNRVFTSTSWKLTGPYRALGRRLKTLLPGDQDGNADSK